EALERLPHPARRLIPRAADGQREDVLRGQERGRVEEVQNGHGLEDRELERLVPGEALHDGLDLIPVAAVALDAQPVAEGGPRVVVEVVDAVELPRCERGCRELLQRARLLGEEEAEEGSLVLAEPAEEAHERWQDRWVEREE